MNTWTRLLRLVHLTGPPNPDVHVVVEDVLQADTALKACWTHVMLQGSCNYRQLQIDINVCWHSATRLFFNSEMMPLAVNIYILRMSVRMHGVHIQLLFQHKGFSQNSRSFYLCIAVCLIST